MRSKASSVGVTGAVAAALIILGALGSAITGYVLNIIELVHSLSLTGLVVGRAIGVFIPPVGIFLGLFL